MADHWDVVMRFATLEDASRAQERINNGLGYEAILVKTVTNGEVASDVPAPLGTVTTVDELGAGTTSACVDCGGLAEYRLKHTGDALDPMGWWRLCVGHAAAHAAGGKAIVELVQCPPTSEGK